MVRCTLEKQKDRSLSQSFPGMFWLSLMSLPRFTGIWEGGEGTRASGAARAASVAPAPHEQWLCLDSPVPTSLWSLLVTQEWHKVLAWLRGSHLLPLQGFFQIWNPHQLSCSVLLLWGGDTAPGTARIPALLLQGTSITPRALLGDTVPMSLWVTKCLSCAEARVCSQ